MMSSVLGVKHALETKPGLLSSLISVSHGLCYQSFPLPSSLPSDWLPASLQRLPLHKSDPNAIAVLLPVDNSQTMNEAQPHGSDKSSSVLGFLGRQVAKWAAVMIDSGFVDVEAWLDRREAVQLASGGPTSWNLPVRLIFKKVL